MSRGSSGNDQFVQVLRQAENFDPENTLCISPAEIFSQVGWIEVRNQT